VIPADLQEASGIAKVEPKKSRSSDEAGVFFRTDKAVVKQLRLLAAETEKEQKALLAEALNLLFARYGKGQIA
jgi:hypothetical protein